MKGIVSFGEGVRPLVVIPGLSVRDIDESASYLPGIFRKFTGEYRIYVIDRPETVSEDTTNADLAESYYTQMCRLGISSTDIIGISQGGMIAQHIAVRHPDMVHRLVLGVTLSRGNATSLTTLSRWLELAGNGAWEALNRDIFNNLFTPAYLEHFKDAFKILIANSRPADPERFIRLAKACLTGGPYDELDRISCPTFVIGAGKDTVLGTESAAELASSLKCGSYIFEDYGHGVYDECPDFYAKAYDFLTKAPIGR